MTNKHSMRANRDKQRDIEIVDALRQLDAPTTVMELRTVLPHLGDSISAVITVIAVKYPYPIWRLRGAKAGSTKAQYVYSDTQPYNAVLKFPEWKLGYEKLQDILDIDLTEHARAVQREQRKAQQALHGDDPQRGKTILLQPVSPVVDLATLAAPKEFQLLEKRDEAIIFTYDGVVYVGKPVRI